MAYVHRLIISDEILEASSITKPRKTLPSFVHSGASSFSWRQTVEYSSRRRLSAAFYCRVIVRLSIMLSLSRTRSIDISTGKWFDGKYSCASDRFSALRGSHLSKLMNRPTWNMSRRLKNPIQLKWENAEKTASLWWKINRFYTFVAPVRWRGIAR